ncbi:MAG TPA: hypothetical protein DCL61_13255 [Cyanobacteria bacterium UBA12227]|nr:hypothetical protein [Cyanobacteria bacterium UBA12227]HAX88480.1 hypothetical protein [Cyanobacteria bacterium UBA11370]HBY81447.1 hypothetical protein [Cyanobacteria bacterium UBA11148]
MKEYPMNPFVVPVVVKAGVFAAIGSKEGLTIAERIVSAISDKLVDDYTEGILQPDNWIEVASNIPHQNLIKNVSNTRKFHPYVTSKQLANECISMEFPQQSRADLTDGIESLIETLPKLELLNCLSISFSDRGDLMISLAMISLPNFSSLKVNLKETIVNYSNKEVAADIDKVFGSFEPLDDKPYFVSVKSLGDIK